MLERFWTEHGAAMREAFSVSHCAVSHLPSSHFDTLKIAARNGGNFKFTSFFFFVCISRSLACCTRASVCVIWCLGDYYSIETAGPLHAKPLPLVFIATSRPISCMPMAALVRHHRHGRIRRPWLQRYQDFIPSSHIRTIIGSRPGMVTPNSLHGVVAILKFMTHSLGCVIL